jgi:glycosyltransferase involved in cell wall biosynthesis
MRALVVAPQPFFTPRGTPFSVYYRTMMMAEAGVRIDLLTYGDGADVDLPGVRIHRIPRLGFLGPIPVGPSPVKAVLDVLMVLWTVALLATRRHEVVHAHEEAVFWCRFLKPVFGFRLIYDMHSSLPQQLTNFRFTESRVLIDGFRWLEDSSLAAADAVITICPDLAEYAEQRLPDPTRHVLIENSIFDPVRLSGGAKPGGGDPVDAVELESGVRHVGYAGTFEAYQGIDLLIRAFAHVAEERSDIRLLLVGGTADQVEAQYALARDLGVESRVRFTGRRSPDEARDLMRRMDVLVSPRTHGTNTPLKIYEQLASGLPLVATAIWSHTQVLSDALCFLAEPEPESFAHAIEAALEDRDAAARKVAAARATYDAQYSRAAYERKLSRVLDLVV